MKEIYSEREKYVLLGIARRALRSAVLHNTFPDPLPDYEALSKPAGAFVTLHHRGRLRGCIGQLAAGVPLVDVVAHCAVAAARDDPRFRPVKSDELDELEIEISILSPVTEIRPEKIEIGRHGLVVTKGSQRGVLLPQVPVEQSWTPERFLQETCVKAGLDRNAWTTADTCVEAFTAEIFCESEIDRTESQTKKTAAE